MRCKVHIDDDLEIGNEETGAHLYQIAREATTNAARHARGGSITIHLTWNSWGGTLSVVDDGVGIEEAPTRSDGLGLRIMRYRSKLIGATLEVGPGPGGGTIVRCELAGPN
jgi:signal transduction histidine kinase